ncbi:hypothetical protein OE88DRAFT_1604004, partial [Heliocybe sulcata]
LGNMADILVLGATGFTGRLIVDYLASHPQRPMFSFAVASRSSHALEELVASLGPEEVARIRTMAVDVSELDTLDAILSMFKVVINAVGPYWRFGDGVVAACVRNNVHYLDLTGEVPWVRRIISSFDDRTSTSVITPSCGFQSVPSDLVTFASAKGLMQHLGSHVQLGHCTTFHDLKASVSDGTLASAISLLQDVP